MIDAEGVCTPPFPCDWAWNDLYPIMTAMQTGGHFAMKKRPGIQYSCCTDSAMPVIFKIEYQQEAHGEHDIAGEKTCPRKEGNTRMPLKTTVTRVFSADEVHPTLPEDITQTPESPGLMEGDTFFVEKEGRKPEGLPVSAWHDLNRYVLSLQLGGNFPGFREGIVYVCSTDGLTPVVFRLKRLPAVS